MVVNSLYDGDHFGDLAMLATLKGVKSEKKQSQLIQSFTTRLSLKSPKKKEIQSNNLLPSPSFLPSSSLLFITSPSSFFPFLSSYVSSNSSFTPFCDSQNNGTYLPPFPLSPPISPHLQPHSQERT